jgi:hypothetical protein
MHAIVNPRERHRRCHASNDPRPPTVENKHHRRRGKPVRSVCRRQAAAAGTTDQRPRIRQCDAGPGPANSFSKVVTDQTVRHGHRQRERHNKHPRPPAAFPQQPTPTANSSGTNSAFPASLGISQSQAGLASDWLMKRNSAVSVVCSQVIAFNGGQRGGRTRAMATPNGSGKSQRCGLAAARAFAHANAVDKPQSRHLTASKNNLFSARAHQGTPKRGVALDRGSN